MSRSKQKSMTQIFLKMSTINTSLKTKMEIKKITLLTIPKMMMSSLDTKKLEISDISTGVSWIWAILDMEMEFSCRNSILVLIGSFRYDSQSISV